MVNRTVVLTKRVRHRETRNIFLVIEGSLTTLTASRAPLVYGGLNTKCSPKLTKTQKELQTDVDLLASLKPQDSVRKFSEPSFEADRNVRTVTLMPNLNSDSSASINKRWQEQNDFKPKDDEEIEDQEGFSLEWTSLPNYKNGNFWKPVLTRSGCDDRAGAGLRLLGSLAYGIPTRNGFQTPLRTVLSALRDITYGAKFGVSRPNKAYDENLLWEALDLAKTPKPSPWLIDVEFSDPASLDSFGKLLYQRLYARRRTRLFELATGKGMQEPILWESDCYKEFILQDKKQLVRKLVNVAVSGPVIDPPTDNVENASRLNVDEEVLKSAVSYAFNKERQDKIRDKIIVEIKKFKFGQANITAATSLSYIMDDNRATFLSRFVENLVQNVFGLESPQPLIPPAANSKFGFDFFPQVGNGIDRSRASTLNLPTRRALVALYHLECFAGLKAALKTWYFKEMDKKEIPYEQFVCISESQQSSVGSMEWKAFLGVTDQLIRLGTEPALYAWTVLCTAPYLKLSTDVIPVVCLHSTPSSWYGEQQPVVLVKTLQVNHALQNTKMKPFFVRREKYIETNRLVHILLDRNAKTQSELFYNLEMRQAFKNWIFGRIPMAKKYHSANRPDKADNKAWRAFRKKISRTRLSIDEAKNFNYEDYRLLGIDLKLIDDFRPHRG